MLAGKVAFIGKSIRTNETGAKQLSVILKAMGYEIRTIELPDTVLHLDKALMMLDSGKVLYCKELIEQKDIEGFEGIGISCRGQTTANIICLGETELVINSSNTAVAELLEREDYTIHTLDLSEFAKGMGGPNCLVMPVTRGA